MNARPAGDRRRRPRAVVIGAGFTGLSAAWELARRDVAVTVLESDREVGGLAGSFNVGGTKLEKFYHHWFTNDRAVNDLVRELGVEDRIVYRPTRTGMYYANRFYRLSTPTDVLRFDALSPAGRLRLGLLALRARRVKDWRALEHRTAAEWLLELGGEEVYRVVWQPLLEGKFGPYGPQISAVWIWNKLKLRGGSRDRRGAEMLAYYRGGFAALAERLADGVRQAGGTIRLGTAATGLVFHRDRLAGVQAGSELLPADAVIATPALPVVADLVEPHAPAGYVERLRSIRYLANVCLVLELDRSLSGTYWLNVNDPTFPFVGVIEHTNFEPSETYAGRHIVYLSKYLPESAPLWRLSDAEVLEFSIPHLQRMFPAFSRDWILGSHVWRARWSQPIVERRYGSLIPAPETPLPGVYLATMAQVYPEDRGTNYAIRDGRAAGREVADDLAATPIRHRAASADSEAQPQPTLVRR
jgi:protoporphyrinogen oxidase